jgi:hypothetical protein
MAYTIERRRPRTAKVSEDETADAARHFVRKIGVAVSGASLPPSLVPGERHDRSGSSIANMNTYLTMIKFV